MSEPSHCIYCGKHKDMAEEADWRAGRAEHILTPKDRRERYAAEMRAAAVLIRAASGLWSEWLREKYARSSPPATPREGTELRDLRAEVKRLRDTITSCAKTGQRIGLQPGSAALFVLLSRAEEIERTQPREEEK